MSYVNDHQSLHNKISLLLDCAKDISKITTSSGTQYSEHSEILIWLNHQFVVLDNLEKTLLAKNNYRLVFSSLRPVFENFWILNLVMNGTKYYKYFKTRNRATAQQISTNWRRDLTNDHAQGKNKNVLDIELIGKTIRVSYIGRYNTRKEIIPKYYFLFKSYNPLKAYLGKEPRLIENYLNKPHLNKRTHTNQKELHQNYFSFSKGVKDHLFLNKIVNKKKWQRIFVHYNYLSMWTHPNYSSVFMIEGNVIDSRYPYPSINEKYNFFLTRLALLYIGHMLKMLLESYLKFIRRQITEGKIESVDDSLIINRITQFDNETDYFWFIDNKPHLCYKWKYCINRLWKSIETKRKLKKIMPNDMPDNRVPYYENPLEILKEIKGERSNRLLGTIEDPFK